MKFRSLLATSFLLLFVGFATAQTVADYFNQGVGYDKVKDWNNSVTAYSNCIRLDPNYEPAIHNRGLAYWSLKNYPLAIADLNRAVQLAPNEAAVFCDRGRMLLEWIDWNIYRGEFDKGYADLQRALILDPKDEHAKEGLLSADTARLNMRADTEYDKGNYAEAVKLYSEALIKRPNNLYSVFGRGRAYLSDNKNDLAIADYDAYIKLNASEPAAYTNRGLARYNKGNYDDAIADQTKAISMNPPWISDAYVRRGMAFKAKKDFITAIADMDQAVKLKPDSRYALSNRGVAYRENKQFDLAIADATRVISLGPNDSGAYIDRGDAFKGKKDYVSALADYNQAQKLDTKSTTSIYRRISVFKEQKDYLQAEAEYAKVIAQNSLTGHHDRGHFYWDTGKLDLAVADFTECIRQKPDVAIYYWDRGEVLRLAKRYAEARVDYDKYVNTGTPSAVAFVARGIYFIQAGDVALAEADFNKAAQLSPDGERTLAGQGYLYAAKGDFVTAKAQFDASLAKWKDNAQALIGRARMLEKQKMIPEAIADLKTVLVFDANNYEARTELERLEKPPVKVPAKRPPKKRG